ncbi:MAG: hypothetical protein DHS20C16_04880 [Phycisphaerae bacterium]|nr:MAG: hypothetical protein DHS20C16_04880 [Phycisphaerae bacterium]
MPRRFIFWSSIVCIAGAVWAFYAMASYASRGGEQAPLFSVRRYDPYGTAAFYELLKRRGTNVSTLENSRILDDSPNSTLIQILDSSAAHVDLDLPFTIDHVGGPRLNSEHLQEWIRQGNTVIQFCAFQTELMRLCGVPNPGGDNTRDELWQNVEKLMRAGKMPDELNWTPDWATVSPLCSDCGLDPVANSTMSLHLPRELSKENSSTWTPIATSDSMQTVMGVKKIGEGRLVVVSSPSPVLNGWIGSEGNLEIILAMLAGPDGTESEHVLIDEWSHGFGHGGTIIALISRLGLLPALAQFGFVILLFVWSSRGIRTPPLDLKVRRRSSVEQVATLGNLYRQVLQPNDLKERTHREVRRRIASALGCQVSGIERRLTQVEPDIKERAEQLLAQVYSDDIPLAHPSEQHARCHRCGYNLFGNTSGICPECGNRISVLDDKVQQEESSSSSAAVSNKRIENDMRRVLTQTFEFTRELKH